MTAAKGPPAPPPLPFSLRFEGTLRVLGKSFALQQSRARFADLLLCVEYAPLTYEALTGASTGDTVDVTGAVFAELHADDTLLGDIVIVRGEEPVATCISPGDTLAIIWKVSVGGDPLSALRDEGRR